MLSPVACRDSVWDAQVVACNCSLGSTPSRPSGLRRRADSALWGHSHCRSLGIHRVRSWIATSYCSLVPDSFGMYISTSLCQLPLWKGEQFPVRNWPSSKKFAITLRNLTKTVLAHLSLWLAAEQSETVVRTQMKTKSLFILESFESVFSSSW